MRITTLFVVGLLAAVGSLAPAAILIVDPAGGGNFTTIQPAIDAAATSDTVALVDHIYIGSGNRDLDMRGKAITVCSQSGNRDACVINCQGSASSPHRAFRLHQGEGPSTVIRGLTIRNAYTTTGMGAISCEQASATVENCRLTANYAQETGGGVGVVQSTQAMLLQDCRFDANVTAGYGAAVALWEVGVVEIIGCEFGGNSGGFNGALALGAEDCSVSLEDCEFSLNDGRALEVAAGGEGLSLARCQFVGNDSVAHLWGNGGMTSFLECTFRGNGDGALRCQDPVHVVLEQCTVVGNGAWLVAFDYATVTVKNCNIAFNSGGARFWEGGGAYVTCTNSFDNNGDNWYGIPDPIGHAGNISEDPLFCDLASGDLTLHADSPCAPTHDPRCGLIGAWPVGCAATTGVEAPALSQSQTALRAVPNPASSSCRIHWESEHPADGNVEVVTAAGRIVRTLRADAGAAASGRTEWFWDGRDAAGVLVPGGVYWVRQAGGAGQAATRIVLRR